MARTFRIKSFDVSTQIALARARIVAKLGDFRRAVEILVRDARMALDSAIAVAARFFATAAKVAA